MLEKRRRKRKMTLSKLRQERVRRMGLNLSRNPQVSISNTCQEWIAIYRKKITMHRKMREYVYHKHRDQLYHRTQISQHTCERNNRLCPLSLYRELKNRAFVR